MEETDKVLIISSKENVQNRIFMDPDWYNEGENKAKVGE